MFMALKFDKNAIRAIIAETGMTIRHRRAVNAASGGG
jgi:hypothetical protein